MGRNRLTLLWLVGALLTFSLAAVSTVDSDVFSVPISEDVAIGQLKLPSGESANFMIRNGETLTIEKRSEEYMFGFMAEIEAQPNGQFAITPLRIQSGRDVTELYDKRLLLSKDEWGAFTLGKQTFKIRIYSVKQGLFPVDAASIDPRSTPAEKLKRLFGKTSGEACCVTCGSTTICGSSVTRYCGHCYADFNLIE